MKTTRCFGPLQQPPTSEGRQRQTLLAWLLAALDPDRGNR
jgi:hypothetical protein